MDKINALRMPEKAIAGGGILMFIASFFDWWHASAGSVEFEGVRFGGGSVGLNGWDAPGDVWSILAILLSLVMAGVIIATRIGNMQTPNLPQGITWGQAWGLGAALVVAFMVLKAWRILAAPYGGFGIGFFIAIVAAAAIAYGGYMLYLEEKGGEPFWASKR